jgi:hypothetical protein
MLVDGVNWDTGISRNKVSSLTGSGHVAISRRSARVTIFTGPVAAWLTAGGFPTVLWAVVQEPECHVLTKQRAFSQSREEWVWEKNAVTTPKEQELSIAEQWWQKDMKSTK